MPTVVRDDVSIYYETSGVGPAVVFIHSFLCDGTLFEYQVNALKQTNLVVNVDIRGHGSSGPADSPFSLHDVLQDVLAVLAAQKIASAIWVGLSIGGFVALQAAIKHPGRVAALVLMDTEAGPQSLLKKIQDVALKVALRRLGPKIMAASICSALFGKSTHQNNKQLVNRYKLQFGEMRVNSIDNCISAVMRREDLRPQLSLVTCPTLVVVGDEDIPLPVSKSREIAQNISNAKLVIIPSAGHLSAIEQPEAVNLALTQFLSGLP